MIRTAMVLAAGLGTRMRPLTNDRPKALVEVGGKTLIDHALDRLAEAGVETAVVNVHHFADLMEAHLARRKGGPRIVISDERAALLDSGGGIADAAGLIGSDPIFVANTDVPWIEGETPALKTLQDLWDPQAMDIAVLLAARERSIGFDRPEGFGLLASTDHGGEPMDGVVGQGPALGEVGMEDGLTHAAPGEGELDEDQGLGLHEARPVHRALDLGGQGVGGVELGDQPLPDRLQHVVPGGEIEEEGALRDAGLADHILHPRPAAIGLQQAFGGLDDLELPSLGMKPPPRRSVHGPFLMTDSH